ncbi:MAG: hypothetical protein QNJ33_18655 [Crocosphaera sp.]|nr:hypothetical protein [Crocosphaera sp.]
MSKKLPLWLFGFLLIFTTTLTTQYFSIGMMGLTVFILAYLTKGMRLSNKNYRFTEDEKN